MPARAPVQCGRAVGKRPGLLTLDEPCNCALSPTRRRLNNQAGPLESRRRTGKRHMTGYVPTPPVFPVILEFAIPPTKLQWKPPTSTSYREQKSRGLGIFDLFSRLFGWNEVQDVEALSGGSAAHDAADAEYVTFQAAEAQVSSSEELDHANIHHSIDAATDEPKLSSSRSPGATRLSIEHMYASFRRAVSDSAGMNHDQLLRGTTLFARWLRRNLQRDRSFARYLDAASLDPLDPATRSLIGCEDIADQITATIRRTLLLRIEALLLSRSNRLVDSSFWLSFAQRICSSRGKSYDILLFLDLMRVMPTRIREQIPSDQIVQLGQAVALHLASHRSLNSRWCLQADRFSRALQGLSADQRRTLDNEMNCFTLRHPKTFAERQRLLFSWLIVKAFSSCASTSDIVNECKRAMPCNARLSSVQLWHLANARLSAIGALEKGRARELVEAKYVTSNARWTTLVLALLVSGKRDEGLRALCSLLSGIGEFDTLTLELNRARPSNREVDILQAIAVACDDHNRALAIYDAIQARHGPTRALAAWNWSSWSKYAERIIKDPAADTWRLWEVLGLSRSTGKSNDLEADPSEVDAKMDLLNRIAKWYLEATHISDRQTLRELQRVIYYQRRLSGNLSSHTLACVTDLVTRDLSAGRRGRTTRLKWLINLVDEAQGREQARKAAIAIKGWRWTMWNQERTSGGQKDELI